MDDQLNISDLLQQLELRIKADIQRKPKKQYQKYYKQLIKNYPQHEKAIIEKITQLTQRHKKHPAAVAAKNSQKQADRNQRVNITSVSKPHFHVKSLLEQADTRLKLQNYQRARDLYLKSIKILDQDLTDGAKDFGSILGETKLNKALSFTEDALKNGILLYVDAYHSLLWIAQNIHNDLNQALKYASNIVEFIKRHPLISDSVKTIDTLNLAGGIYRLKQQYTGAISIYKDAIEIAKRIKANEPLAYLYGNISISYRKNQQYQEARKALKSLDTLLTDCFDSDAVKRMIYYDNLLKVEKKTGGWRIAKQLADKLTELLVQESALGIQQQATYYSNAGAAYLTAASRSEDSSDQISNANKAINLFKKLKLLNPSKDMLAMADLHIKQARILLANDDLATEVDLEIPNNLSEAEATRLFTTAPSFSTN